MLCRLLVLIAFHKPLYFLARGLLEFLAANGYLLYLLEERQAFVNLIHLCPEKFFHLLCIGGSLLAYSGLYLFHIRLYGCHNNRILP